METGSIAKDATPRRGTDVVARPLQTGGGVFLHVPSGSYHGTNETGWLVWELVDGARTVAEIERELAATTGGDPATVATDVAAFLADLEARRIVALED